MEFGIGESATKTVPINSAGAARGLDLELLKAMTSDLEKFRTQMKTIIHPYACSGGVVVTAYDFESGRQGSNPEWGLIYYEALITAQGLPEPSSLRGGTLSTRTAVYKGCSWGMQVV